MSEFDSRDVDPELKQEGDPFEEILHPAVVIFSDGVTIQEFHYRASLLREGVLVDVSEMAREAGFTAPVAVTAALWKDINEIPAKHALEDAEGRLWDVLSMARFAVQQAKIDGPELLYKLVLHVGNKSSYTVRLVAQPGDSGELVITLSNPAVDKEVQLGETVITPGALEAFVEAKASPGPYLARHMRADWGDLEKEDIAANNRALAHEGRLVSAYNIAETGKRIWIITEWDRSVTTVLLPSEY